MLRKLLERCLAASVFAGLVWLMIACLEATARRDWLGPVPGRNLELGTDARGLFYTEVEVPEAEPRK